MNHKLKTTAVILGAVVLFYALQYGSTAVHYNCTILKDDCVPPINGAAEIIYRVMVHPSWLDTFDMPLATYAFQDGSYSFWTGEVDGKPVVIRVGVNDSPTFVWIKDRPGVPIHPASAEQVKQWLTEHPEYELAK